MANMCIICAVLFCSHFISLGSAPDPSSGDGRKDPAGGVVYVRWGRKTCPGNATLVYSGKKKKRQFLFKVEQNCKYNTSDYAITLT